MINYERERILYTIFYIINHKKECELSFLLEESYNKYIRNFI